jgi:mTERF domain-containing protein
MFNCLCKTILDGGKHTITIRAPPSIHNLGFLQNPFLSLKYISSTTNQQPFVVSYLINTLGFSPETALSASSDVNFETPEKADIVVNFFKKQGFSQTQISNLVRRLPSVLISDPEKTFLPKIEFFSSKGISSPNLTKLLHSVVFVTHNALEDPLVHLVSRLENKAISFLASTVVLRRPVPSQ